MAANKYHARVFLDVSGQWRWSLRKGRNVLAVSSESYRRRRDAIRGLELTTNFDVSDYDQVQLTVIQ